MSVPKGKRSEGQLRVLTKANALMSYTIKVTTNEKHFPKRYRWCLTNRIVSTTADITDKIIHANSIYVKSSEDIENKDRRLLLVNEALELTYVLLNQVQIAYEVFKLPPDKVEYWVSEIIELQRLIRGWRKGQPL